MKTVHKIFIFLIYLVFPTVIGFYLNKNTPGLEFMIMLLFSMFLLGIYKLAKYDHIHEWRINKNGFPQYQECIKCGYTKSRTYKEAVAGQDWKKCKKDKSIPLR